VRLEYKGRALDSIALRKLLVIALVASALTVLPQFFFGKSFNASANVVVPESSTATSLYVSPPEFKILDRGNSSLTMDYSAAIGEPTSWDENTQRIAVEIAVTALGQDDSVVFRTTGSNCMVDLSSSATSNSFGSAFTNGANSITGVTNSIFVLNDRTPQLTLNGAISDVLTAIQRVQISCNSYDTLKNKYIRIGAVPTEDGSTCGGADNDTRCDPLYYLFSTQHYYRFACSNINNATNVCNNSGQAVGTNTSNATAITRLRDRAELLTVGVDATNRTGANRRGWVATLATRDEILLTNSLNAPAAMVGTTDMNNTWSWNSNWGGSGSNCTTSEGTFYWLGPDEWCHLLPTWNHLNSTEYIGGTTTATGVQSRYWRRNGSLWETTTAAGLPTNGGVDLGNTTIPTIADWPNTSNGKGFAHFWATDSGGVVREPNSSGDYIYGGYDAGDGIPGWDDAAPNDGNDRDTGGGYTPRNFFVEFCSPNQSCTPPDISVASTEILPDQTFTLREAGSKLVDAQVNWFNMPQLLFGTETTTNVVICLTDSTTSNAAIRFSLFNMSTSETFTVISGETVTSASDAIFESGAPANRPSIFEGSSNAAFKVYNSWTANGQLLRIWLPPGNYFNGTEKLWVRVIGRSEIGRPIGLSICSMATASNSWNVYIKPYLLQQTVRQGEVQSKK